MSERDFTAEKNRLWSRMKDIDAGAKDGVLTPEEKTNWDTANADLQTVIDAEQRTTKMGSLAEYMSKSANPAIVKAVQNDPEEREFAAKKNGTDREPTKEERARFNEYLRDGTINGIPQMRALQADQDTAGGFSVPVQQFQNELIKAVYDNVYIYAKSRNFTVDRSESLGAPVLSAQISDAQWGTELTIGTADTAMTFNKRELRPHPMVANILVSKKLLRQSGIDVEALVRDQLGYKFGVALEKALLNGMGFNSPIGIFSTGAQNPISTGTDTLAASSANIGSTAADDLVAVKYQLKQQYWNSSVWVINRLHALQVRQMKDANNQFLWQPGGGFSAALASGIEPAYDSILGRPVLMSEYAPVSTGVGAAPTCNQVTAITGNTTGTPLTGYVAALFDPSQIWTVQALTLSIQHLVELKAETNQDEFIARMEIDGMPVLGEAFARYRLKGY